MRKVETKMELNMVPMIDIIFQLFIFFICTLDMQNQQGNVDLKLAMAPDGKAVDKKDPRTVTIDVDAKGHIQIGGQPMGPDLLVAVLRSARNQYGKDIPIVVRGDASTLHRYVKTVMDCCSRAGLSQVMFAAIKEKKR